MLNIIYNLYIDILYVQTESSSTSAVHKGVLAILRRVLEDSCPTRRVIRSVARIVSSLSVYTSLRADIHRAGLGTIMRIYEIVS